MFRVLRPRRGQSGTSTLEVAGIVPLVVLVTLLLAQASLALYAVTTGQTAVRQAARAYSQGDPWRSVLDRSVPSWLDVTAGTYGAPGHGIRAEFDVPDLVPFFDLTFTRESLMP